MDQHCAESNEVIEAIIVTSTLAIKFEKSDYTGKKKTRANIVKYL